MIEKNKTSKKSVVNSPEMIEAFFKEANKITLDKKIYFYRSLLSATLFVLNDDRSKEAKRFRHDVEKHVFLIKFVQCFVGQDAPEYAAELALFDYQQGLIPLLKKHGNVLRAIAVDRLQALLGSVVNGIGIIEQEQNLFSNPVVFNAHVLEEVFALPLGDDQLFHNVAKKTRDCVANRLIKMCEDIATEANTTSLSKIRCCWLLELLRRNGKQIEYVWGQWRLMQLVEHIMQDHYAKAEEKQELTDREKAMAYDLLVLDGRIDPAQFNAPGDDCCCGSEHDSCEYGQQV